VTTVADALSLLDIYSLKIQDNKGQKLTLPSGLENSSINKIKLSIQLYTALIFKEQAKVKNLGLQGKNLAKNHNSIQQTELYDLLYYKDTKQDLHSSIIETRNKDYCPDTVSIYFTRDKQEQKRLSRIPLHDLLLHKMLNIDCLFSTCQVCQMTQKESTINKYGLPLPNIAESDTASLGHGLCGSVGSI
jgi:hypothetical protein